MAANTRVLFLDLDGVLNSSRTCLAFGDYPHGLDDASVAKFDPVSLRLVRNLCRAAGLVIVLSSAWRRIHKFSDVAAALDLPIVGATPMSETGFRGGEIAEWLADHPEVSSWAIIDDDTDMLPGQLPRFVRTAGQDGMLWSDFARLCALFGVTPIDCSPRRNKIVDKFGLLEPPPVEQC